MTEMIESTFKTWKQNWATWLFKLRLLAYLTPTPVLETKIRIQLHYVGDQSQ